MSYFLAPTFGAGYQSFTNAGIVNSGGTVATYTAGSTTPTSTYTDSTGMTANANPITLDSSGRMSNEVWLIGGTAYKFIVKDANGNILGTYDNISGINDSTLVSEWISSGASPTFISTNSFSVGGDQTATFTVNRRIQASITAGTVYGTITASSFSAPLTTVTVTLDFGNLDSGLSVVNVALLNPSHPSVQNSGISFPQSNFFQTVNGFAGPLNVTVKTTKIANAVLVDFPIATGTSTSSSKFFALGTSIAPLSNKFAAVPISNNGSSTSMGRVLIDTGGTMTFYPDMTGTSTWVGTGLATIGPFSTIYIP